MLSLFVPPSLPKLQQGMFAYCANDGSSTNASALEVNHRLPILLGFTTKKWRFRIANYIGQTQTAGNASISGVWVGPAVLDSTGEATGVATSLTQALTSFTSNADGSDYVSAWVEDPAAQFQAGVYSLLCFGWTSTATTACRTTSKYFYRTGTGKAAEAATANPGAFSVSNNPFWDIRIEYQFVGSGSVGIAFGDSLSSAFSSDNIATPNIWMHLAALKSGGAACISGRGSQTTAAFTDITKWDVARLGTGLTPDYAVGYLGSNDALNSYTLATLQANVATIQGIFKNTFGVKKTFWATIPPRFITSPGQDANETLRLAYNAWLRTVPLGFTDILDFDLELRDPANARQLFATYAAADNVHHIRPGHHREAMHAAGILPALAA